MRFNTIYSGVRWFGKRDFSSIGVVFLLLFLIVSNWFWVTWNSPRILDESADHTIFAATILERLKFASVNDIPFFLEGFAYNMPPPYWIYLLFTGIFGFTTQAFVVNNFIYITIIVLSMFKIGARLYDRPSGLLCAFVASMFPGMFASSRAFSFDYFQCAMFALTLYVLLTIRRSDRRRDFILLGICLGLGLLTKTSYVIPAGIACLLVMLEQLTIHKKDKRKRVLLNFILAGGTALALSIPFYSYSLSFLLYVGFELLPAEVEHIGQPETIWFSFHWATFYLQKLTEDLVTPFYSLFALWGFVILFRVRRNQFLFLSIMLLVTYAGFTAISFKLGRFIIAVLPIIAIAITAGVSLIRKPILRNLLGFFIVAYGFFNYFMISYMAPQSLSVKFFGKTRQVYRNWVDIQGTHAKWNLDDTYYKMLLDLFDHVIKQNSIQIADRRSVNLAVITDNSEPLTFESMTASMLGPQPPIRLHVMHMQPKTFARDLGASDYLVSKIKLDLTAKQFSDSLRKLGFFKGQGEAYDDDQDGNVLVTYFEYDPIRINLKAITDELPKFSFEREITRNDTAIYLYRKAAQPLTDPRNQRRVSSLPWKLR